MNIKQSLFIPLLFANIVLFSMKKEEYSEAHIKKLILAEQGHVDPLLDLMENALNSNKYAEAVQWMARFKIRVRMDVACSIEPDSLAIMSALTVKQWTNPKFGEIASHLPLEQCTSIFLKEVEWAQNKLIRDELPTPFCGTTFSPEKCKIKRQKFLDKYTEEFKQQK